MRAALLAMVGALSLETGLALSPWPWLAFVVGGACALWLGLQMETGKDQGQGGDS
jgi:hypothetical protein